MATQGGQPMPGGRLIFLEFNELCPDLLERWMSQGVLPNFQRLHSGSEVFTVQAETDDNGWLEPWIQWYSLHTGIDCFQHGVRHLTDGPRLAGRITDIWQALVASGLRVGNMGSMNAAALCSPGSFYVPDPWCTTETPYPTELGAYHRLVLQKVQENSNRSDQLTRRDYVEFLKFVSIHGLSNRSVRSIIAQLVAERWDRTRAWRRATLLDQLQRDVFFHYWKRSRPDFSTFFLNSTAHFQHSFFHLAAPERFNLQPGAFQDTTHREAVMYGFQRMDELIGEFLKLEAYGARLVFVTALSQQPWANAGRAFYRPYDMTALLSSIGLHPNKLMPVMAQQYVAEFTSRAEADAARTHMEGIRLGSSALFDFSPADPGCLFFGINSRAEVPADAIVSFPSNVRPAAAFASLCYRTEQSKMTVHHPRSMLWIHTGKRVQHETPLSILDIFPTLLDYYGAAAPTDSGFARTGQSFLPQTRLNRYGAGRTRLAA
jgi:hypothetical protein